MNPLETVCAALGSSQNPQSSMANRIDHTLLMFPPQSDEDALITKLCQEARLYRFFAVCVRPRHVAFCKRELAGSAVKVATVIGFPIQKVRFEAERCYPTVGNVPLSSKLQEIEQAVQDGVDELDWVTDVAQLKQDAHCTPNPTQSQTYADLVQGQAVAQGRPLKVIIETDLLTDLEIQYATRCCVAAQAFMVKTSTGMVQGGLGATEEVVAQIQRLLTQVASSTQIKASGGIKTVEQARNLISLGAARIGTSAGCAIMENETIKPDAY